MTKLEKEIIEEIIVDLEGVNSDLKNDFGMTFIDDEIARLKKIIERR